MPIDIQCATCGQRLRVGDGLAGKQANCPKCKAKYRFLPRRPANPAPAPLPLRRIPRTPQILSLKDPRADCTWRPQSLRRLRRLPTVGTCRLPMASAMVRSSSSSLTPGSPRIALPLIVNCSHRADSNGLQPRRCIRHWFSRWHKSVAQPQVPRSRALPRRKVRPQRQCRLLSHLSKQLRAGESLCRAVGPAGRIRPSTGDRAAALVVRASFVGGNTPLGAVYVDHGIHHRRPHISWPGDHRRQPLQSIDGRNVRTRGATQDHATLRHCFHRHVTPMSVCSLTLSASASFAVQGLSSNSKRFWQAHRKFWRIAAS